MKHFGIFCFVSLLTFCLGLGAIGSYKEATDYSTTIERTTAFIERRMREDQVTGVSIALVDGQKTIWSQRFGFADKEKDLEASPETVYEIGSISKTITATAIMRLQEQRLIDIDYPLTEYLPEFSILPPLGFPADSDKPITIRLLLQMRSGLGDYGPNPQFEKFMEPNPLQACTPEQLVKFSLDKTREPDKEFHYTNTNYILLGMLIEKVTNNSFPNEMQRRILQPLGMSHTFMLTEMKMPTPYAHGYRYEEGKVVDGTYSIHPSLFWTAGGIVSTAADQLIWAKALLEGRLLSPQAHSEQFTMKPASSKLGFYGFGVMNMNGLIGHGGNYDNLYTSFVGRYHGYDCVILVNGQTGDAEEKTFRAKAILQKVIKETEL